MHVEIAGTGFFEIKGKSSSSGPLRTPPYPIFTFPVFSLGHLFGTDTGSLPWQLQLGTAGRLHPQLSIPPLGIQLPANILVSPFSLTLPL